MAVLVVANKTLVIFKSTEELVAQLVFFVFA